MNPNAPDRIEEVAIIGLAGRFPGARNVDEFWRKLCDGSESISFFSEQELEASRISPEIFNRPDYVNAKAILDDVEMFDASFFGLTPREAEVMDPQHRLFLECAWEALELAGYSFAGQSGRVGVYAGSGISTYLLFHLFSNPQVLAATDSLQVRMTNDKDFLTTQVSYKLNLQGPSVAVQTACSTSLVAVHLACQGLLDGECDMALAGGVSVTVPTKSGYIYREGSIWSPDGHCRAFDARAAGTAEGNGAGVVVLKRLTDALTDGDYIHAIIKASAVNNDGSLKAGYTAPSVESQRRVVTEAVALAGVSAESISYVEAHGSGTPLGDPIEIEALTQAFRASTNRKNFCAIGSVKSNIGHLDAAAGIASLIKTIQALKHKLLPPHLHFETPNPKIDFANSPFYVNTELSEWKRDNHSRRAGVSSLGIGGTNAHLVLEESPEVAAPARSRPYHLLLLSAKSPSALEAATANLAGYLKKHSDLSLADVAYTLQVGRRAFRHRRMLVCREVEDAVIALETVDPRRTLTAPRVSDERKVAWMFPGVGDHYVDMAQGLYRDEPTFRAQVDHCSELLKPYLNLDLREVLYPRGTAAAETTEGAMHVEFPARSKPDLRKMLASDGPEADDAPLSLNQTFLTQPAVFVIEYALAQLLLEWGIRPQAMIGHSIGEFAAACIAGVFTLGEALMIVAERARMIHELPGGAMLAVPLSPEDLQPWLNRTVSLSASNGPALSVIGGPREAIQELERQLNEQGVVSRRLQASHAFHSPMMDPIFKRFSKLTDKVRLRPPQIPFVSNVTGTWITSEEATSPDYWAQHLCRTVRFAEGLRELLREPRQILLEVGPGQTLSTLAMQSPSRSDEQFVLSTLRGRYDTVADEPYLLNNLGQLWLSGVRVDWDGFSAKEQRRRLPLPTYPFERQRYWVEPGSSSGHSLIAQDGQSRKTDLADWFYVPVWKQSHSPKLVKSSSAAKENYCWLIFLDDLGLGNQVAERLAQESHPVVKVSAGEGFANAGENCYTVNSERQDDYNTLIRELRDHGLTPDLVMHFWTVTRSAQREPDIKSDDRLLRAGFYSLLFLAQAIGEQNISSPIHFNVVSNHLQDVTGDELICPLKATIKGPCKVIPQEYGNLTCQSIDIVVPQAGSSWRERLVDQLIEEAKGRSTEPTIAYRSRHRWVQTFETVRLEQPARRSWGLRAGGSYLITGVEETSLIIAEHLARTVDARLTLVAPPDFPACEKWERWLGSHDDHDEVSRRIRRLNALQALGGKVLIVAAELTDDNQMSAALARIREQFGALHGVIHTAVASDAGIMQLKRPEAVASSLDSKVKAVFVLESLTRNSPLDFFVLCSSTVAIAGGFGQVDACAVNAFLDAFAHYRGAECASHTVAINWHAFQWDNWQLPPGSGFPELQAQLQEKLQTYGISAPQATDALDRILSTTLSQVIVCPEDLRIVIAQSDQLAASDLLAAFKDARRLTAHPRAAMTVAYVPPRNEIERAIAEVWQEAFGIDEVGVEDNFFELAGNSLLAIQIVTRLRSLFQVELPMTSMFESATVAELARQIESLRPGNSELQYIGQLLDEIEAISPEEVERRLAEELAAEE